MFRIFPSPFKELNEWYIDIFFSACPKRPSSVIYDDNWQTLSQTPQLPEDWGSSTPLVLPRVNVAEFMFKCLNTSLLVETRARAARAPVLMSCVVSLCFQPLASSSLKTPAGSPLGAGTLTRPTRGMTSPPMTSFTPISITSRSPLRPSTFQPPRRRKTWASCASRGASRPTPP